MPERLSKEIAGLIIELYDAGFSMKHIARTLDISPTTVKRYLYVNGRARKEVI